MHTHPNTLKTQFDSSEQLTQRRRDAACLTTASLAKTPGGASTSTSSAEVVGAPEVPTDHRMQPTAPQSTGGGPDMDLPTVQSMDWVFQNKQLYFLAQYLAQVSLARKLTVTPKILTLRLRVWC